MCLLVAKKEAGVRERNPCVCVAGNQKEEAEGVGVGLALGPVRACRGDREPSRFDLSFITIQRRGGEWEL